MYSASRCNNPTYLCGTSKYPVSRKAVWAQNGKLSKLVWTYRLGTVFVPRKYLYQKETTCRREKKCFPLVGAITPLTCAGRQNTPSRGRWFGPRTDSCQNWDGPIAMVPCLNQGNIYTKRKLRACRDQKCIPLVGAITPLPCVGRQNTPSRGRRDRAQNEKLPKLGRTYRHGTVSAPMKY